MTLPSEDPKRYSNGPTPGVTVIHTDCLHEIEVVAKAKGAEEALAKAKRADDVAKATLVLDLAILGAVDQALQVSPVIREVFPGRDGDDDFPFLRFTTDMFPNEAYELRVVRIR